MKLLRKPCKLVSIIMSTKDTDESMLRLAIESILDQTYSNLEFIIICDGGKNDYDIIKSYTDPRIKIIRHAKAHGLAASINEGVANSEGDYIARMDSDDVALPFRLQTQVAYMEKHKDIDICTTAVKNFGNDTKTIVNLLNTPQGIKAELFLGNCLAHPTAMLRKAFIDKNSLHYNEDFRYTQDYELWTRCSKLGNIAAINKICLLYRIHDKQISSAKLSEQENFRNQVYLRNLRELGLGDNSSKNFNSLSALHSSHPTNCSIQTLASFIIKVLERNQKKQIYDQNKLTKYLYYRLFTYALKCQHQIIFRASSIGLTCKKGFLKLRCNIMLHSSISYQKLKKRL